MSLSRVPTVCIKTIEGTFEKVPLCVLSVIVVKQEYLMYLIIWGFTDVAKLFL